MDSRDRAPHVEVLTAGIDWYTATMLLEYTDAYRWQRVALSELEYVAAQGYDIKERHMLGYYGHSAGNCFVGAREADIMAQFTGFHADHAFRRLRDDNAHISRLDLQVTAKFRIMPLDVATKGYDDAITANNRLPAHRRRKIYIISGSDGGDTLYVGSPASSQRCRIYNKEVQSEDVLFAKTWRYEVVLRNEHATSCATAISRSEDTIEETTKAIVHKWCESRGITPLFDAGRSMATLPPIRTLPTDTERQLRWLREQVRPTIRRLTEQGYGDMLLELLGFPGEVRGG